MFQLNETCDEIPTTIVWGIYMIIKKEGTRGIFLKLMQEYQFYEETKLNSVGDRKNLGDKSFFNIYVSK